MKFMKLGSRPDLFQSDGDSIRYVATELATDVVVNVGDVKFYLHKFPLLSKSFRLQKLVAKTSEENNDEINIHDIPGGPAAFEICAKFCYGMVVTLNAYNVVAARCAAEYLEMFETVDKGNLIYKIDVFLSSTVFRSWKDSIIVLRTTKSFFPLSEELNIVGHCVDSVATKACTDPSKVDWSYTYNRSKLPSEITNDDALWNGVKKQQSVPKDWWVEDLCDLQIDLYKRVIKAIRAKGRISSYVVGESLRAYALRRLPDFNKGSIEEDDLLKYQYLVDTITLMLPEEKSCVPCSFLLRLLQASIVLECGETGRRALMRKIAKQFDELTVSDLLIHSATGETTVCHIDIVQDLVEQVVIKDCSSKETTCRDDSELPEVCAESTSDAFKTKVATLIDGYLFEAARDPSLPVSKFINLAEIVSSFPRSTHDGIYRAIDMYLKEHPGLSKSEKKQICRLMDCKKLSAEACIHAVQNERLPLRVVVQVLFFEQARAAAAAAATSGSSTPDIPRMLLPGSHGSSISATTNTDEDWDGDQTSEELKALKGELASLRLRSKGGGENGGTFHDAKLNAEKIAAYKVKNIFSRLWSNKERRGDSSSDTSDSPASTSAEETRSTPSRSRRHS